MINETFFIEFQKFMDEQGFLYASQDKAMQAFLAQREDLVMDMLHEKKSIDDEITRIDELAGESKVVFLTELMKLEEKERERFERDEHGDIEGYLSLKALLADLCLDHHLIQPAKRYYEDLLNWDKSDTWYMRYPLMTIYYRLGDLTKMERLMKRYNGEQDDKMLILMMMAYIVNLEHTKARHLFQLLYKQNNAVIDIFSDDSLPFDELLSLEFQSDETLDKRARLIQAIFPIFESISDYMMEWLSAECEKLNRQVLKKKIANPIIALHPVDDIFHKISQRSVKKLQSLGLHTKSDFKSVSEANLLEWRVAKTTIQQLKKNGVILNKI